MRDLVQATVAIIIVCALLFFAVDQMQTAGSKGSKDSLTVYNWGEYIDPDLIDKFEDETGIKVIYETFDSNEAMLTKIEQGGSAYDIAVPSEYTIESMKDKGLL
ncbi:MAG TPA: spermidine/putrescine ABC transporter substrate-binding protein, partial [Solibacillus sp.]